MASPSPLIVLAGVEKSFVKNGEVVDALGGVDLEIAAGDFVTVVGPSGCGKSSLLNLVAGISMPTAGEVAYGGRPVAGVNTRVGYMTQDDNLLPWKTVAGNIALPRALRHNRLPRAERDRLARALIEKVGLTGFDKHYPSELSGGMRKRVALARTLSYEPETLLMDEPFAALDAQLRIEMQSELLRLWQENRQTVLFITHDISEALLLGTRIVVLSQRPGRVKAVYAIDLDRPEEIRDLQFTPEYGRWYREISGLLSA